MSTLGTLLLSLLLAYVNVARMQECGRVINANLDRIQAQGPPGKAGPAAEIDYEKITQIFAGVMKAEMASFRDEITAEKVALLLEIEKIRSESNEKIEIMSDELKAHNAENTALRSEIEKIRLESQTVFEELKGENKVLNDSLARLQLQLEESEKNVESIRSNHDSNNQQVLSKSEELIRKLAKCANEEKCMATEETAGMASTTPPVTEERYYHIEVLFVLDGSGSVGKENFTKVKEWVKLITSKLNIDTGNAAVGVIQYSHYFSKRDLDDQRYIVTEIRIGQHTTYASFAEHVDRIKLQNYTTYTGHALRKAALDFERTENYGKVWNRQVMILLTDGKSDDSKVVPLSAQSLRDMGLITYVVGVGNYNIAELRLIANGNVNDDTRVYAIADFDDLGGIVASIDSELKSIGSQGNSVMNL